jgi:hypothetical protein
MRLDVNSNELHGSLYEGKRGVLPTPRPYKKRGLNTAFSMKSMQRELEYSLDSEGKEVIR